MKPRILLVVVFLIFTTVLLAACNLPAKQASPSQTTVASISALGTPSPVRLCDNQFFPNAKGDNWEYSGTNTAIGDYTRIDSITSSSDESFTLETKVSGLTYSVNYTCTPEGLVAEDPVQQYAGAILNSPEKPVNIKLGTVSGITLPHKINPGDTWQQSAEFEASSQETNLNGRLVFDYTAVGYENVTAASGTYNALRVDATIRIQVTGLRIQAGTYTTSIWMAPGVGIVKSQGTSHVPGVDFSDSMELTSFSPSP